MTRSARLTQADIQRAAKAVRLAGFDKARFIIDFANQKIEVIVGNASDQDPVSEWDDEDV